VVPSGERYVVKARMAISRVCRGKILDIKFLGLVLTKLMNLLIDGYFGSM